MTKKSLGRLARQKTGEINEKRIARIKTSVEKRTHFAFTKDMLETQLSRDSPKIARSFDRLAAKDIRLCSKAFAETMSIIFTHLGSPADLGSRATCARLLLNASQSLVASIETARHGFPQQSAVISRQALETLCAVLEMRMRDEALKEFHDGNLKSTKSINWAKRAIPAIGPMYGFLSHEFVHVSALHGKALSTSIYKADGLDLVFTTKIMRSMFWLTHVVAECVFFEDVPEPLYWEVDMQSLSFSPSAKGLREMQAMIGDMTSPD